MIHRVILSGTSRAFIEDFRKTLEDCGFEACVKRAPHSPVGAAEENVVVYELTGEQGVDALCVPDRNNKTPFLIYAAEGARAQDASYLKDRGLIGVITPDTSNENAAFLVSNALFYNTLVRRNLRVQVNLPVTVRGPMKSLKTNATQLSRDGVFVVTLNPFPVNTSCEVELDIPGGGSVISTPAKVLYGISVNTDLNIIASPYNPFKRLVSHPGMAVFFTGISDADREAIDRYIETLCR